MIYGVDIIKQVHRWNKHGWPEEINDISKERLNLMAQHYLDCAECRGWFKFNGTVLEFALWFQESKILSLYSFEICGTTGW